jgi:beta-phosphoglucomutase-like phosphatase (HAD superfamily)
MPGDDPGVRGVVFDLDDLLVGFRRLDLRATQAALGRHAASFTERDHRGLGGVTDPELFRILRILFNLDAETSDLTAEKEQRLIAWMRREGRPGPGIPGAVHQLRADGFRVGLASASSRRVIDAALGCAGLIGAFQVLVSGDEVERARPDGFLLAAHRLGVPPRHCLAGLAGV